MAIRIKRPIEFYFNLLLVFFLVLFSILLLSWRPETSSVINADSSPKAENLAKQVTSLKGGEGK